MAETSTSCAGSDAGVATDASTAGDASDVGQDSGSVSEAAVQDAAPAGGCSPRGHVSIAGLKAATSGGDAGWQYVVPKFPRGATSGFEVTFALAPDPNAAQNFVFSSQLVDPTGWTLTQDVPGVHLAAGHEVATQPVDFLLTPDAMANPTALSLSVTGSDCAAFSLFVDLE
jgi:hypothetical protein